MMHVVARFASKAKPYAESLVDTLFPPACAACSEPTARHGALCVQCWQNMHFITAPFCARCGLPFEYDLGENALCGKCIQATPAFRQARAVLRYDDASKSQLLAFKYHDKTQLAPIFGEWLARVGAEFIQACQIIIPVPLHYRRLVARRYNQAALIAGALSRETGLPMLVDTLRRIRATPTQAGLTRLQRDANMRGAFMVPPAKRPLLQGKSVLLIDDVMTTGATLNACARALHDAGAVDVYVLTVARTVLAD